MNDTWVIRIIESKVVEWVISIILLILFIALRWFFKSMVKRHEQKLGLGYGRSVYVIKFFNFTLAVLFLFGLFGIWNIQTSNLLLYFGSFFTVAGVALFAQWSIISNVTSSVILFFHYPFRIGSRIRIQDKDDTVEGVVQDITFFTIHLLDDNQNIVSYPNNLATQKAIILLSNPEINSEG